MDQHNREKGTSGSTGATGTSGSNMSEYSAGNVNRDYSASRTGTTGTSEEVMARTKDKTQQVTEKAKDTASEVTEQATERAKGMIDQQKSRAVHSLSGVASALRETGHQLQGQDQAQFGEYAEKIAEQIDRFSTTLRDQSVEDLLYEAESFARREPQLFLGGAMVLGLLAARFFKSSSARARQQGYGGYDQGRYYGPTYTGYNYGRQGYSGQRYSGSSYTSRSYSADVDQPGTTGTDRPTDYDPTDYR